MHNLDRFYKSAFTVDNVIFGFDDGDLKVLLIKRGEEPFKDQWALPGYFVKKDEDLYSAAKRVLGELTGLKDIYLEQVKAFGAIDRHPSGRAVTVAYYSLVKIKDYHLHTSSIAEKAQWFDVATIKKLPFDHYEILEACMERLRLRVRLRPIGFELLPPKFTLTELQHLYEAILGENLPDKGLDKRNFRKRILSMGLLKDTNEVQEGVAHRPAKLYSFDKDKYEKLSADGANFEFVTIGKNNSQKPK